MIIGLVGISGVGKSFLRTNAQKQFNQLHYLKSVTTRPRRINETDGIDKYFVTDEEFNIMCSKKEVILEQIIYGYRYAFKKGDVLSDVTYITEMLYSDVTVLRQYAKVITINIFSNQQEKIRQILNSRYGTVDEAKKRIKKDIGISKMHRELALNGFFDYRFENFFDERSVLQFNKLIANILCAYPIK